MQQDIEEVIPTSVAIIGVVDATYNLYVRDLCKINQIGRWNIEMRKLAKKYSFKGFPRSDRLRFAYKRMIRQGMIEKSEIFEEKMSMNKIGMSGVMIVTIATKPDNFSCCFDCYYCPNEQGQPRSYLSSEPVLANAKAVKFDTVEQFHQRAYTLYNTEYELDKLEVIVLGGTWSCYDHTYQEEFVRDIYYAANIFMDCVDGRIVRDRVTLEQEQRINETASCRIISLTLETRPDMINSEEIKRLRRYGCTRVQIGVQHIDNEILRVINRRCYYEDIVRAIKMLKDNGFKVDVHLMPNLPTSTPEKDIEMLKQMISSPDLQVDQWKLYPCEVVEHTKINEWYRDGKYVPYSERQLMEVLKYAIVNVPYHVRINRIIRDIPLRDVIAGVSSQTYRDDIHKILKIEGLDSQDIRYREVKSKIFDGSNIEIVIRKHYASDGIEYFISHESHDQKTLYSLLRLRINSVHNMCVFPELQKCTFIRELHVHGKMICHDAEPTLEATQHKGLGVELVNAACSITKECGYDNICVISGVGVVQYYTQKLGFERSVFGYLVKKL